MTPDNPEGQPEITQPENLIPPEIHQLVENQMSALRADFTDSLPDPEEDPEGYEEALLSFEEGIEPFFREDLLQHAEGTYLVLKQLAAAHQLSRALCTEVGMNLDIARLVLGDDKVTAFTPGLTPVEADQPYPAVLILDTPPDGFRADTLESATAAGGLIVLSQDNSIRTMMENSQAQDPRLEYYKNNPSYQPVAFPDEMKVPKPPETTVEVDGVEDDKSVNLFVFQKNSVAT